MTETAALPLDRPRRLHFDWVLPALFRPRAAFRRIAEYPGDAWLTPLLVLTLAEIARVLTTGQVKQAAAASGQVTLPPDFQFWSPDQQAQFTQAQQATSSPVFVYVFPGFLALMGVWIGWLLVSALLHLVLTMLGGRSATRTALNFVAWASLPFAVRSLVRAGYAMFAQTLISSPGLSGFAPTDTAIPSLVVKELLVFVDVYLIWHIVLIVLGARLASSLAVGKVIGGVLVTMFIILALQALPGVLIAQLGGLTVIRPFF